MNHTNEVLRSQAMLTTPSAIAAERYLHAEAALTSGPSPQVVASSVTLIVYGWQSVEPGTMAWVFPDFDTAIFAARALRNAVRWAIVAGEREGDPDEARTRGAVLAQQT